MAALLTPIDLSAHPRRDHFRLYTNTVPCSFAATVKIDVTGAIEKHRTTGAPFYPLMMHAILKAANSIENLRWDWFDREAGIPGLWNEVGANFTFFHQESETFSCLWLPWAQDEQTFVEMYSDAVARAAGKTELLPLGPIPSNNLPISMIPWINYSAFHVQLPDSKYLRPVVTLGKYEKEGGESGSYKMPITLQMHHAAGDGWHAAKAFEAIEAATKVG